MGTNESPVSSPDPEPLAIPSVRRKKTNTYSRWSEEEDVLLRQAISEHGETKWALVATMVPGRTPMQCSTRWQGALNTSIHKGKWLPEEDAILIKAVAEWQAWHTSEDRGCIPWANIAATLPRSRTGVQALARWSEALDPRIKKGKWTAEEDASLMYGIQQHGKTWIKVADAVRGRTQRQCRTRFMQISEKKVKEKQLALAPQMRASGGWSE
ncbi:Homeodomain-like protein [Protomyces lactucae-debilis]|uniref:Homeodomain-like protein n=1 Tax=Protomyces lactucae-debilis TaxID=2754530 RepID=A0A1Y2F3R9_PROLT|nr:Homeodomain-like protein [Protomyces lactucae-debilis]ORY78550.1 Homeodomain-like protein [Protomyces lactucae-debilis]